MEEYVSIILPVYNRANILLNAVNSILNQTYKYFELIIVDDGSTDDTERVVHGITDARVRYIGLDKNYGPSVARNRGICCAQYDFIAFEDSDDCWRSNKLELQMAKMRERNAIGMVYCAYSYCRAGRIVKIPSDGYKISELEGNIFESLWKSNKIGTPTILIKRECIDSVGMFSEKLKSLEDWEFVLRVAQRYEIGYVNLSLVNVHYSVGSVNGNIAEQLNAIVYMLEKYKDYNMPLAEKNLLIFERLVQLKEETIIAEWKNKLIPWLINTDEEFNLLLVLAQNNRKRGLKIDVMLKMTTPGKLAAFLSQKIDLGNEELAIYGAGDVGIALARCMEQYQIHFRYMIDRNEVEYKEFQVVRPSQADTHITALLVTIGEVVNSDEIYACIGRKIRLINIYDIINEAD